MHSDTIFLANSKPNGTSLHDNGISYDLYQLDSSYLTFDVSITNLLSVML